MMPPSDDSFVEIASNAQATARVLLPTHDLLPDRDYSMEAKGNWRAVWDRPMRDVGKQALDTLTQASSGEFKSDAIEVKRS